MHWIPMIKHESNSEYQPLIIQEFHLIVASSLGSTVP